MKKILMVLAALGLVAGAVSTTHAGPEQDKQKMQDYFKKKFPKVPLDDFANGVYALDKNLRAEWEQIMEFPPYELVLEDGEKLMNKKFKNGKTIASCFKNGGKGIAQNYPYFDSKSGKVKTIEAEIIQCLKKNGEYDKKDKNWAYKKGKSLIAVSAYIHNTSRGKRTNVKVPNDPRALKAYNAGKQFYYARRGQLNFSCAHCHIATAGMKIGGNLLSPTVGQTTHWPAYRSKWGAVGTIHRRYTGCNKQVRAKPQKAQGANYTNLQYFHTYMSNGLPLNAPGTRF